MSCWVAELIRLVARRFWRISSPTARAAWTARFCAWWNCLSEFIAPTAIFVGCPAQFKQKLAIQFAFWGPPSEGAARGAGMGPSQPFSFADTNTLTSSAQRFYRARRLQ